MSGTALVSEGRLFDSALFYDPAGDSWRPENLTPYLPVELVGDDTLHDWGQPDTWGDLTSPAIGDGFGGWAA